MQQRKWRLEKFRAQWKRFASRPRYRRTDLPAARTQCCTGRLTGDQRDRHAHYLSTLALIAATLEKIALEIRHLQRTEVREAEEPFGGEQRGSSAMPHKRNPVTCETNLRPRAFGAV